MKFFKLLVIFFISPNFLFSQSDLFENVNLLNYQLDEQDSIKINLLESRNYYLSIDYISFNELSVIDNNGILSITLENGQEHDFKVNKNEYISDLNFKWYGKLLTDSIDYNGFLSLVSLEGVYRGSLKIGEDRYEISSINSTLQAIAKLDSSILAGELCEVDGDSTTIINDQEYINTRSDPDYCEVRCLIIYTENALNDVGSIEDMKALINLNIFELNVTLENSDVSSCDLTVELAGIELLSSDAPIDDNSHIDNLDYLATNEVNDLREFHEADIVVMLAGPISFYGFGTGRAVDNIGDLDPPSNQAFASVCVDRSTYASNATFVHEVGHIFGAGHRNSSSPSRAHRFFIGLFNRQHTVTIQGGQAKIMHYSNPKVKFSNKKTGTKNRNNARFLRENGCKIGAFEETIKPWGAFISGDNYSCPCTNSGQSAEVQNPNIGETYTYTWETSSNGINWTQENSNSSSFSLPVSCTIGSVKFVRVTIEGSFGQSSQYTKTVESALEWPNQNASCALLQDESPTNQTSLSIYPSISHETSFTTIDIDIQESGSYSVFCVNSNSGEQFILKKSSWLEKGKHEVFFQAPSKGIYIIYLVKGKKIIDNSKLIIHEIK